MMAIAQSRCSSRWLATGIVLSALGCGSGSGLSTQSSSPAPPAPTPAMPNPAPPPSATSPPPKPIVTEAKPADAPKLSAAERAIANADPRNIFEVVASGPQFEVGTPEEQAAADRMIVDPHAPGSSSTEFIAGTPTGGPNILAGRAMPPATSSIKLPAGFSGVSAYGYSDQGLPKRIRCEKTGNLMALVPLGATVVGSDNGPPEVRPAFRPVVPTFYMDETEVTLEQYERYREDAKAKKNLRIQLPVNEGGDPLAPALGLPWGIVQTFAAWAGKELPTEVEFEKAARGPEGFRTPWGNGRAVFGRTRTADTITNVVQFPADCSVYGIFDLAGNAREWCSDYYSEAAHTEAAAAAGRRAQEWPGPRRASVSGQRVVKGNGEDWSAWHRQGRAMTERHLDVGFRCVLRIKPAETAANSPTRN